jgi:chloramphenicol-sensitive protein RarD
MKPYEDSKLQQESLIGVTYAATAFLIWGLSPIYWKELRTVPALETIMHRVVWSFLFLIFVLTFQKCWNEFVTILKTRRTLLTLLFTTIIISSNWLIFIWAVNHEYVLQTSLGYYIAPLVNVLLGMVFLKERLRPLQSASVVLAGIGVLYLTIHYGQFPWVSLSLAITFGFYGLIRKVLAVSSTVGLSVEMLLLSGPAAAYLFYLNSVGLGSFFRMSVKLDLFLMASALFTALPLLLFTRGARRIHLTTLGFLQYIAPSCFFLLAVFLFKEPISSAQVWTFILIWVALCIYSTDSVRYYRRVAQLTLASFHNGS